MTRERDRIQKNANEYIVKNCPAYKTFYPDTGAEPFTACAAKLPFKKCQDCTDCIVKQVIEKCKENLSSLETYIDIRSYECTMLQDILDLFDIEEIMK